MADIGKVLSLLGTIFLLMTLIFNITPSLPRLPWDISINKPNFSIYLPIVTAVILSVILSLVFNFFRS